MVRKTNNTKEPTKSQEKTKPSFRQRFGRKSREEDANNGSGTDNEDYPVSPAMSPASSPNVESRGIPRPTSLVGQTSFTNSVQGQESYGVSSEDSAGWSDGSGRSSSLEGSHERKSRRRSRRNLTHSNPNSTLDQADILISDAESEDDHFSQSALGDSPHRLLKPRLKTGRTEPNANVSQSPSSNSMRRHEVSVSPSNYIGYRSMDTSRPAVARDVPPNGSYPDPNRNREEYNSTQTKGDLQANPNTSGAPRYDENGEYITDQEGSYEEVSIEDEDDDDEINYDFDESAIAHSGPRYDENGQYITEHDESNGDEEELYYDHVKETLSMPSEQAQQHDHQELVEDVEQTQDDSYDDIESPRRSKDTHSETYSGDPDGPDSGNGQTLDSISYLESNKAQQQTICYLLICLGVVLFLLAGVVGGLLGAFVFGKNGSPSSSSSPGPAPSAPTTPTPPTAGSGIPETTQSPSSPSPGSGLSPTMAPTGQPTSPVPDFVQNQTLYEIIVSRSPDRGVNLEIDQSPQNSAYQWLESDPLQVAGLSELRLVQRYAMATFYFSTNGNQWLTSTGWLSSTPECEWYSSAFSGTSCDANDAVTAIQFDNNGITGELPPEIGMLTSVTMFVINNTGSDGGLSGSVPSEIGNLPIQDFVLSGNTLTQPISESTFEKWNMASNVVLSSNTIPGPIPKSIGKLASAIVVDFSMNGLTGSLPSEIAGLSSIQQFRLSQNRLSGNLPETLADLTTLKGIYFDSNQFSGTIPDVFASLTDIKAGLNLFDNSFSGILPTSLGKLTNMKNLRVQNNLLTGPIPNFSNVLGAKEYRFDGNNFNGTISNATCRALSSGDVYADCLEVACPCCTICCVDGGACSAN